jgi:hypothetical protein
VRHVLVIMIESEVQLDGGKKEQHVSTIAQIYHPAILMSCP